MITETSQEITTPVLGPCLPYYSSLISHAPDEYFFSDKEIRTAVDVGLCLLHIGLNAIPLDENLQAPELLFKNLCTSTSLSDTNWIKIMRDFDNVGVITGRKSQNLFVVRCYTQKAYEYLQSRLADNMNWVSKTGDFWDAWFFCAAGTVSNRRKSQGAQIFGHDKVIIYPGCRSVDGITSEWINHDFWHPCILDEDEMEEFFPNIIITPVRDTSDEAYAIEKYKQAMSIINDPEKLTDIDKAYIFSETHYFGKGRSGAGKKLVYKALIARGQKESIYNFRASLRELQDISTLCIKTISKYLKEFERKELIKLLSKSPLGKRYKLEKSNFYHIKKLPLNVVNLTNLPAQDIWTSWSGLGACTKNMVEFLINAEKKNVLYTAKEIANYANISYPTVLKRLKQLREFSLVVKNGGRWKIEVDSITPSNFEEIARKLGVDGKYNTRKKQTDFDRQQYSVFLARLHKPQQLDQVASENSK